MKFAASYHGRAPPLDGCCRTALTAVQIAHLSTVSAIQWPDAVN